MKIPVASREAKPIDSVFLLSSDLKVHLIGNYISLFK